MRVLQLFDGRDATGELGLQSKRRYADWKVELPRDTQISSGRLLGVFVHPRLEIVRLEISSKEDWIELSRVGAVIGNLRRQDDWLFAFGHYRRQSDSSLM